MYPLVYIKLSSAPQLVAKQCFCKKLRLDNRLFSSVVIVYKNEDAQPKTTLRLSNEFEPIRFYRLSGITNSQVRTFHLGSVFYGQESSSKVEETIKSIKEEKKQKSENVVPMEIVKAPEKELAKKPGLWQKVKTELVHYYHGFRLLGLDIKVSSKYVWRILKGHELSRREHRLLVKTTGDMFRLIPFSVFIIVPFMEFLLPVAIKLFPGMLPSTFETSSDKEAKMKQALKVKIEMAKFLQKTLDEMAVQSSDHRSEKAKEFSEFFYKVRETGAIASNEEIMKFSKLFEDEITLDSLSKPQLIALCRVLDVQTLGTTKMLIFLLRMKLRSLAADDRLIEKEGIDTLTRAELQQACRARGMRAYGMPEQKLREQLTQWLDLSLNKKVPPTLLLLSRALMVPDTIPMSDKLKATISALPDDIVARTKGAIGEKEGKLDHETSIEIIKMEEKRIEEERAEEKEIKEKEKDLKPEPIVLETLNRDDEITTTDVKVLEQALDSVGKDKKMSVEKEELKELKEEMAEYQEDIQELHQLKAEAKGVADIENIKVSTGAKRLFNKVNRMINKMDAVLLELEQSEKKMKEKMDSLPTEKKSDLQVTEELIRIDELIAAIKQIQKLPDDHRLTRITEILGKIDDDRDGAIKIEDVLKVIELIGKEDIKLNSKQLNELVELMEKEEVLELEDQIQKALEKESKESKEDAENEMFETEKSNSDSATGPTKKLGEKNQGKVPKTKIPESKKLVSSDKKKSEVPLEVKQEHHTAIPTGLNSTEQVKKDSITPTNVPPSSKKAEGSKQL